LSGFGDSADRGRTPSDRPLWRHLLLALVLVAAQALVVWHQSGLMPHADGDSHHCAICLAAGALGAALPSVAVVPHACISHELFSVTVRRDFRAITHRAFCARAPPCGSTPRLT